MSIKFYNFNVLFLKYRVYNTFIMHVVNRNGTNVLWHKNKMFLENLQKEKQYRMKYHFNFWSRNN